MKCEVVTCDRDKYCRGFCRKHYEALRVHGDPTVNKNWKGGIRSHFMYGAWNQMINRCHNPNNSSYGRYGAVGVTVCDRWQTGEDGLTGFQCFLSDMGERPEGKTLDRIDPTGPYEPGNCRWATLKEQRNNLSAAGDARAREKQRAARIAYWDRWHAARGTSRPA